MIDGELWIISISNSLRPKSQGLKFHTVIGRGSAYFLTYYWMSSSCSHLLITQQAMEMISIIIYTEAKLSSGLFSTFRVVQYKGKKRWRNYLQWRLPSFPSECIHKQVEGGRGNVEVCIMKLLKWFAYFTERFACSYIRVEFESWYHVHVILRMQFCCKHPWQGCFVIMWWYCYCCLLYYLSPR